METYVAYHTHSDLSLLDSCTSYQDYIDRAAEERMTAISISEHGRPLNWVAKKLYAESKGLKYIHSCEVYLTRDLSEKVRDNYHCVMLCRNWDGVQELNSLISLASTEEQFYYVPRITFEQFMNVSDNIITTSACLASPLSRLEDSDPWFDRLAEKFTYYEVQPHDNIDQKRYNIKLVELAKKHNKPLIAAVDCHSLNGYKNECRDILLVAKHKYYGDEGFDLVWKTRDELVEAFKIQGVMTEDEYLEAIENTNRMAEQVEEFGIDPEFKYPVLYGSREKDSEVFKETVERMFREKLDSGVIPNEQKDAFRKAIDEEIDVFQRLKMEGFLLSMSELVVWAKAQGMAIGTARGSVGGSRVAFVTDIIDLNPEEWQTNFYRFANPDRLDAGDIDIDCIESDRPKIFSHIVERFGEDKTARVAAYGTLQDKAAIDEIGRALDVIYKVNRLKSEFNVTLGYKEINKSSMVDAAWKKYFPGEESLYSLKRVSKIKQEYENDPELARLGYKELFYYFDGLVGTRISQSVHPAGMIISSVTLDDNYGVFVKDGERCLMLDMDNAHDANLIKYDLLLLKTVKVISDTCKMIGIPYPKTHEIDFCDQEVWDDIVSSSTGLFQFESKFAFDSLRRFRPRSIADITLVTAALRPSGASYRDRLLARKPETGWPDLVSGILKKNYGYLVYQEDVLKILQEACGLSGGEADTVRRGIAKKKIEIIEEAMPRVIEGYCERSNKPREEAEEEAKKLVQILIDSSSYMFGYNHAVAYSLLSYFCAYFRHYYPLEFVTSFLNNAANDEDIKNGTEYARQIGIEITMPKWGSSRGEYYFDKEKRRISKGLASIKYMSEKTAEQLYRLAQEKKYESFLDLAEDIATQTELDSRQMDILIKIDFFSDFGNQRELLYLADMYSNLFKKGEAKQIKKTKVEGTIFQPIIEKYSIGTTKAGRDSANYILTDIKQIIRECEQEVKRLGMRDLSVYQKVRNFEDVMGYPGYVSGKMEDRNRLYINSIRPLTRKKDGKQFGYSFYVTSIGSGISNRFTVRNRMFDIVPVKEKDIVCCERWSKSGNYFNMDYYTKVQA